jgi:hypothetical protein
VKTLIVDHSPALEPAVVRCAGTDSVWNSTSSWPLAVLLSTMTLALQSRKQQRGDRVVEDGGLSKRRTAPDRAP